MDGLRLLVACRLAFLLFFGADFGPTQHLWWRRLQQRSGAAVAAAAAEEQMLRGFGDCGDRAAVIVILVLHRFAFQALVVFFYSQPSGHACTYVLLSGDSGGEKRPWW